MSHVYLLAAIKQLYECLSILLSVCDIFSLCLHHIIIMKFSGVVTNDRSDVHTNGQAARSAPICEASLLWRCYYEGCQRVGVHHLHHCFLITNSMFPSREGFQKLLPMVNVLNCISFYTENGTLCWHYRRPP